MSSHVRLTLAPLVAALSLSAAAWSPVASACSGSEPLLGSMCIFAGNFAPRGYALANGQLLSIAQNTAVFSILGTTYGGNGQTNFALPDTRGRVVVGPGQGPGTSFYTLGEVGGAEQVTLTTAQLPAHNHAANTTVTVRGQSAQGNADAPTGNTWAAKNRGVQYSSVAPNVDMMADTVVASTTVGITGGNQPVSIVQPYVAINYLIALEGIFPSRN